MADASGAANTQVGVSRAVATTDDAIGTRSLASSTTRTGESVSMPGNRQVRCGSSDSTVPMPTRIASASARIWCTRARAASPVMPTGLRPGRPALPSAEIASFSSTCGRPSRMRRMWPT